MTDRELLEAAAKAAGCGEVWYLEGHDTPYIGPRFVLGAPVRYRPWNPLQDDGDALRLACALKLNIMQGDFSAGVNDESEIDEAALVRDESERAAVLRRLIVRAAAAIGERRKG